MTSAARDEEIPTPRLRPERRRRTRRRLIDAAERLLEEHSYTDISIERLVREAGVTRPTFYGHFKDKSELLAAIAATVVGEVVLRDSSWASMPADMTRDDLRAEFTRLLDAYTPVHRTWRAIIEAATYEPTIAKQLQTLRTSEAASFAQHIARGQAAGTVHPDIDGESVGVFLAALLERGVGELVGGASPERLGRLATSLTDIVWNALHV